VRKLVWRRLSPESEAYLQQDAVYLDLSVDDVVLLTLAEEQWRSERT
jgi:hypothetical protein